MDAESARAFLRTLPHVAECKQWGENLVYFAGDKAIGGKMFCLLNLDGDGHVISFAAGPERFHELQEIDGLVPAPYFARLHWIAAERWSVLRNAEWLDHLQHAYDRVSATLPPKTRKALALPPKELKKLIAEARAKQAAKAAK